MLIVFKKSGYFFISVNWVIPGNGIVGMLLYIEEANDNKIELLKLHV